MKSGQKVQEADLELQSPIILKEPTQHTKLLETEPRKSQNQYEKTLTNPRSKKKFLGEFDATFEEEKSLRNSKGKKEMADFVNETLMSQTLKEFPSPSGFDRQKVDFDMENLETEQQELKVIP